MTGKKFIRILDGNTVGLVVYLILTIPVQHSRGLEKW